MADSAATFKDAAGTPVSHDGRTTSTGDFRPVVVLGNDGDGVAGVTTYGNLRVTMEPSSLFSDTFDTATGIETLNRWDTSGTVTPTVVTGAAVLNPGTTASASTALATKPRFQNQGLNFLVGGWFNRFENNAGGVGGVGLTGAHRFMGFGLAPGTWQAAYVGTAGAAGPLNSGYGFEVDTDGNLYAVVYDNSVRTRADAYGAAPGEKRLNLTRDIFDGRAHQFSVVIRSEMMFWYIDGNDVPAAAWTFRNTGFSAPDVQNLPLRFHTINGTAAAPAGMVHRAGAVGVGDTGRNGAAISDGAFPWREAQVTDPTTIPGAGQPNSPTDRSWGNALNVNPNAIQKATYRVNVKPVARASTADTFLPMVTLHHLASSTKTIRLRKVTISGSAASAAGLTIGEVHRIAAAPTGTAVAAGATGGAAPRGTAGTGSYQQTDFRDPAGEATVLINGNTVLAATSVGLVASGQLAYAPAAAVHAGNAVIYDWAASEERKPLTARAGVLEGWAIGVSSIVAMTWTATIEISFTEE